MNYAIIKNGVVQNVVLANAIEDIHLEAGELAVQDDTVGPGWRFDGATFTRPPEASRPVPETITDRQFFQQLALQGEITQDEALAAVATGTMPATLAALIDKLPASAQFDAKMKMTGAVEFHRSSGLTKQIAAAKGWTDKQVDDLWTAASSL